MELILSSKSTSKYVLFAVTTKGSEIKTSEAKMGEKEKKETAKEAAQDLQLILSLEGLEVINNKVYTIGGYSDHATEGTETGYRGEKMA